MHVQYYTFPSSLKSLPAVRFVMVGLSELRNLTRLLSADLQTRNPYHQSRSLLEVIRQSLNMSRQNVLQEAKVGDPQKRSSRIQSIYSYLKDSSHQTHRSRPPQT